MSYPPNLVNGQIMPYVSVIIPTFNDNMRLKLCLEALEKQTYPKSRYKVIVVDNNSNELVDAAPFEHVEILQEKLPGPETARNTGISAVKSDLIAFTDSDCIPSADWIEKGVQHLERAGVNALIGGHVDIFFTSADHPTHAELYDRVMGFPMKRFVEKNHFIPTCNLFVHTSVFGTIGVFDPTLRFCGDSEWTNRAYRAGHQLIYADDVVIQHPARTSMRQLVAQAKRNSQCSLLQLRQSQKDWVKSIAFWGIFIPPLHPVLHILKEEKDYKLVDRLWIIAILLWVRLALLFQRGAFLILSLRYETIQKPETRLC